MIIILVGSILLLNNMFVKNYQTNLAQIIYDLKFSRLGILVFIMLLFSIPIHTNINVCVSESEILIKSFWGKVINEMYFADMEKCFVYEYDTYQTYYQTGILKHDILPQWCIISKQKINEKYKYLYCHLSVLSTLNQMGILCSFNPKGYGEANDAFLLFIKPILEESPDDFISLFGLQAYETSLKINDYYQGKNIIKGMSIININVRKLYRNVFEYINCNTISLGMRSSDDLYRIKEYLPTDIDMEDVLKIYDQKEWDNVNRTTLKKSIKLYEMICCKEAIILIACCILLLIAMLCDM